MRHGALALALILVCGGCASATAPVLAVPADIERSASDADSSTIDIPRHAVQGGLVIGRVTPGSHLVYDQRVVRVGSDGAFVIGVARELQGPIQLELTPPNAAMRVVNIEIRKREFALERIEGVPPATVNPPPAIAERIEREQAEVNAVRSRDDDRDDYNVKFAWPLTGRISGVYGSQRIYNGTPKSPHSGLDVAAPQGTPTKAPAAGIVSFANPDLYLTGGTVLIDHGHGLSSNFLHLSRIDVKVGERIEQGQVIGLVGATGRATGPHMHWGMNWFEVRVDPQLLVDPAGNPQSSR